MNKIKFNELSVLDQVSYINDELKKGYTLSTISDYINISRKTIGKPLLKAGYVFNKSQKQYILDEYKPTTDILQVAVTTTDKRTTPQEYKSNTNIFNSKDAKDKMLNILDKHDDIEEMLNWYHNQKNVIEVDLSELKIDSSKLTGEVKVTTVRLYSDVWDSFREFMLKYKELKSMDLISMALIEYIEKYDKI